MRCFAARNFGEDALANTIQGMRIDLEIVRRFHPEAHDAALYEQGRSLSRRLALDTVAILRELHEHVRVGSPDPEAVALADRLALRARAVEQQVRDQMLVIARELELRVGRGKPLTYLGDRVATPLQQTVSREA
jgi:hypothetical protein